MEREREKEREREGILERAGESAGKWEHVR